MRDSRRMLKIVCLAVMTVVITLFVWIGSQVVGIFREEEVNYTKSWDSFNKSKVSRYFCIPREAVIIEATETSQVMGYSVSVRFKLPATRSPKEWIEIIARRSGIDAYKKNDYLYDGGRDVYTIEYLPAQELYEAVYQWD